jgi:hypothetical protein
MPITEHTLSTTPYLVTPIVVNQIAVAGNHIVHDPTDRKSAVYALVGGGGNVQRITFTTNLAGAHYYLPFSPNKIHSMRLPANPGFGATFLTANLEGCWIFVERKATGDVVVFHANAGAPGMSPTALQTATTPLFQTPLAIAHLTAIHAAASAHYGGLTTNTYTLKKYQYLNAVNAKLLRKAADRRTGVNFPAPEQSSYTTFVGFHTGLPGAHWRFWFQTYSQLTYQRPVISRKSFFANRTVNPDVTHDPFEVVEAQNWLNL